VKFALTPQLLAVLQSLVEEAGTIFGLLSTSTNASAGPAKALALHVRDHPTEPISSDLIHAVVKSLPPESPAARAARDHIATVEPAHIGT
jgi:hypothetical protein